MLIGNRDRFALELLPVSPSWEVRYAPEAAAWAGLSLWVNKENLSQHVRHGEAEVQAALFVPLGPFADWIVRKYPAIALEERPPWLASHRPLHELVRKWGTSPPLPKFDEESWLDARDAFWERHFALAGADGAWLPNVAFLREDDELTISWEEPHFAAREQMTFLSRHGKARVRWDEFADVLQKFVDVVAKSFEERKVTPYAWVATASPRLSQASPDTLSLFCARPLEEIAVLLGVAPADLAKVLGPNALADPATSPLCQVLRDLPPAPAAAIGAEARELERASCASSSATALEQWRKARSLASDASRDAVSAVQAGLLAAQALRQSLGLDGQPIGPTTDLLNKVGVTARRSSVDGDQAQMLVAAAKGCAPVTTILDTAQTQRPWGQRFEEARALGHALLDPLRGEAFGAASTNWAQSNRRRRSGAFAAELLMPESALRRASGGHLDAISDPEFVTLMQGYGVGARTTAFQLYNKQLVSKVFRDELVRKHARDEIDP